MFRSTREVAKMLGIGPSRLSKAVWDGRLDPPGRGPSGAFLWTEADIQRASWTLRRRSADDVLPEAPKGGDGD